MRNYIKDYLKNREKICPKELNIKVKKVSITTRRIETGFQYLSSDIFFDKEGNKLEYKKYYNDKILEWEKFIYENKNELSAVLKGVPKLIEGGKNKSDFNFSSEPIIKNPEEEGLVYVNEMGQKIISVINSEGKLIRKRIFNRENICIEMSEFSNNNITYWELYNHNGELKEARNFRLDGQLLNCLINTFNEKSQLCRLQYFSRNNFPTHDTVLKYNNLGLLSEVVEHPRDPNNAHADLKGASAGWNHKYFYRQDKLLEIDEIYQCGKHKRTHEYTYEFW